MTHHAFGVSFCLLVVCGPSRGDDSTIPAKEWVAQYQKLGGIAYLNDPDDEPWIGILKRSDQTTLVSLKGLKPASGIHRVAVQGFNVTDEDIKALAGWKELDEVDIWDGKKVTDKGIKALAAMPKLRKVEIQETAATAASINAFSGHSELTRLDVGNTITKTRLTSLNLSKMPKLQGLLINCRGVKSLKLAKLPKLEWIADFDSDLEDVEITEAPMLTELSFRRTPFKKLILTDLPMLQSLYLTTTTFEKKPALSGLPKLELVDLRRSTLDANTVVELRKAFPHAEIKK